MNLSTAVSSFGGETRLTRVTRCDLYTIYAFVRLYAVQTTHLGARDTSADGDARQPTDTRSATPCLDMQIAACISAPTHAHIVITHGDTAMHTAIPVRVSTSHHMAISGPSSSSEKLNRATGTSADNRPRSASIAWALASASRNASRAEISLSPRPTGSA